VSIIEDTQTQLQPYYENQQYIIIYGGDGQQGENAPNPRDELVEIVGTRIARPWVITNGHH
jgi:hypothetical protein